MSDDKIIIPCGSGEYMLQYRGVPLKTSLLQQRDLDMQIYAFMQKKSIKLDNGERYIPLINGCNKTTLFNSFKSEFDNLEDIEHFEKMFPIKKTVGRTTFIERLKQLDNKWGLVIEKKGDIGNYKNISYFWIKVNDFIGYNYIPYDTAETLRGIGNDYIIKAYGQLLAWYKMKPDWTFTYKSLNEALGYSTAASANEKPKAALDVLGGLGLIKYECTRIIRNGKSIEVFALKFVGVEIKRPWVTYIGELF